MELDLDIRVPVSREVRVDFVRELTKADVVLVQESRPPPTRPSLLKIRARHHEAAKAVAEGLKQVEVAARTGFSPETLRTLMMDPAFQELVEGYRQIANDAWETNLRRAATVNLDFLSAIEERLHDETAPLSNSELFRGYELTGKMAGLGQPKPAAAVQVNVNLPGRIEAARRRAMIIDGVLAPSSTEEPIA